MAGPNRKTARLNRLKKAETRLSIFKTYAILFKTIIQNHGTYRAFESNY